VTDHALERRFFALTPDRVLDAVEVAGRRATGYALALNSLENRVYEVELEGPDDTTSRLVAKFYRPGRWSRAALLDEHAFLTELAAAELPVVPPLPVDGDARTLGDLADSEGVIHYALFAKSRGRAPEELGDEELRQLGRLVARLHHVGGTSRAQARPTLDPEFYGAHSLRLLLGDGPHASWIPAELHARFARAGEAIVAACARRWGELESIRIHGDCHLGNLLAGSSGFFFLDFDDFLHGPPMQDLWLLAPGRDDAAERQRALLVEGYQSMRHIDRGSLRFVEPLRALRILRYAAWIAQRWRDPAFPRAFPDWEEHASWLRELSVLEEQRVRVETALQ
jgi:Ser/Thr protein kinase RdoA (MazF antagonist)